MSLYYLSFATTERHLGATVVKAATSAQAVLEADRLGLNPGGEIAIWRIADAAIKSPQVRSLRNRLVGKEELLRMGMHSIGDLPHAARLEVEAASGVLCAVCNRTPQS